METIKKLKNYWIGMIISPFILVTACAINNNDIDELLSTSYMFSNDMFMFIGATLLVILGSYTYHILKEGILRDIRDIQKYVREKGGVAR